MIPINLDNLIMGRTVESSRIEYKKDWNPEKIIRTICAFANDYDNLGGGYIILGIEEDNGRPIVPISGLEPESVDRLNKELLNICNLIEPRYLPIVETANYDGKTVLIIWIPGGPQRPYKCPNHISSDKKNKSDKSYYIRKISSTVKANPNEEKELYELASREPFDDRINHQSNISDLRTNLISEYLSKVGSDMYESSLSLNIGELSRNMCIARGPKEYYKPLNVGLMFFNERPDNFFRCARIEVVDKPDPTGERMVEKTFYGPLNIQLENALGFIRNYVIKERVDKRLDIPEADRTYNYPLQAVEEILCNAVYHKDYQIPEPITVTITPTQMEILSIPGPDRSISDEDLSNCHMVSSRYRNRRIGDFLKELRLTEGRNTGIPKAIWAMEKNGSESIKLLTDSDRSYLRVIIPVNKKFIETEDVPDHTTERIATRRSVSEMKTAVMEALSKHGCMSMRELSKTLGYKAPTRNLSVAINQMIADGTLRYESSEKNSSSQKICLK